MPPVKVTLERERDGVAGRTALGLPMEPGKEGKDGERVAVGEESAEGGGGGGVKIDARKEIKSAC